ncbi:G0/G1 switch protein 2 [Balaenoptera ricei]|uniref:G0/G1 switch 2 n=2 Tax=Balaenoptera TaxID=9766 RepID=A0A8B8YYI7_BALMU|nr:G0/G1 switch protein 2 [Balaenoptera acutorostrata]XP_036726924.1 G0/G1 switch protein 2 [Balaenoptera musculus]XP_059794956.1 G0/G1 switch protein 2 [Balaenoptera ricei]
METVQELIPLAKELMAQKPSRKLVRLYVLGGVLALFGAVLGLMETLCSPFTAAGRLREREAAVAELQAAQERKAIRERALLEKSKQLEAVQGCRAQTNRLHAS